MAANEWATIHLGSVCLKIGSGATPRGGSEVYLDNGPYALIRSQNVYNDAFYREGLAFIGEKHAAELSTVEVLRDDVLLNITGDSVARCCQVDKSILPARVNQHVAIIRPDPQKLNPRFLRYFLISPDMQTQLLSWAGSGGTRNALTKGMIESFDVPAPEDVNEQRAIAHILGTLDDKIELNRRMNETLETMARALFKSWFVDFDPVSAKAESRETGLPKHIADLFPDHFEDSELGEIPAGWKPVPVPDIIAVNPTRPLRKDRVASYLDMANMPTQGHRAIEWVQRSFGSGTRFINGDTLLARITPCLENGKTAFVDFLADGETGWGSTEYIILRPKPPLPAEFGYYLARDESFRNHVIQNMTGTSGRQRAPASCLTQYLIARPSTPLAEYFGNYARLAMSKIRTSDEQSRTLAAMRDTLLPKLISGELRVKDVERFISEVGV